MFKFNFLPKEEDFFTPFQLSAENMIEGGRLLKDLMEDFHDLQKKVHHIKAIEHKGDEITHDIIRRLNRTFVTPLDRQDIHDLTCALDDIMDEIDAVAWLFVTFKISQPTVTAVKLADILYQATVSVGVGVDRLQKGTLEVNHFNLEVNRLEKEADQVSQKAISTLFEEEKDPLKVMKWKEIYERFEKGTDRCQEASNILERIALKST